MPNMADSAIYLMQTLFRELIPQHLSIQEKVNLARRIIGSLPAHHAFIKDLDKWANEITASGYGDSGLYDLLLHSVDRCYNVNEVYELAAAAELKLVNFLGPINDFTIRRNWLPRKVSGGVA
jgi:hypothetical protein